MSMGSSVKSQEFSINNLGGAGLAELILVSYYRPPANNQSAGHSSQALNMQYTTFVWTLSSSRSNQTNHVDNRTSSVAFQAFKVTGIRNKGPSRLLPLSVIHSSLKREIY